MKTYAVEISISDGALQMFRVGNIAFLNASLQTNKDISWGDIVVSSLPSELCTNGYFFGSIIGNGLLQINKNQIVFKPTVTIKSGEYITAFLEYPII